MNEYSYKSSKPSGNETFITQRILINIHHECINKRNKHFCVCCIIIVRILEG